MLPGLFPAWQNKFWWRRGKRGVWRRRRGSCVGPSPSSPHCWLLLPRWVGTLSQQRIVGELRCTRHPIRRVEGRKQQKKCLWKWFLRLIFEAALPFEPCVKNLHYCNLSRVGVWLLVFFFLIDFIIIFLKKKYCICNSIFKTKTKCERVCMCSLCEIDFAHRSNPFLALRLILV